MFIIKPTMYLWKKDVHSFELEKELKNIFGDFSVPSMKRYQPEPFNHKSKPYYRFRVMEYGLRIKDFSFFNFILETKEDGTVIFKTRKGNEDNWIYFKGNLDIIFDDANSTIIINVLDNVYWMDGTRRYENRFEEMPEKFSEQRERCLSINKEQYSNISFLQERTITEKSKKHIAKIKQNIKNRKANKKK